MGCIFCEIAGGKLPAARVLDEPDVVAFLDKKPLFHGHVLVIPRAHVETLPELPPAGLSALFPVVQRVARAVEAALEAEGSFVAMNNKVSQSVPHLHVHVVPRRKGDGLKGFFWPRTKYASDEAMNEVAARVRARLEAP
ncbi:HIT family protein [Pendulispora albinea]|uniref:HIT family protein n=1 Tax=Pendulispora albinea TaxID=2741071 RepID=A0ABZ2M3I5_9BACT